MIFRVAAGLAFGRAPANRWRQVCLPIAALVSTAALLFVAAFDRASDALDARLVDRSAVVAEGEAPPRLLFLLTFDTHQDRQFEVRYLQPLTADAPLPPGMERWPDPGEYVISAGLKRAVDASPQLLMRYVGATVLGDVGTTDRSEWLAYRVPPAGAGIDLDRGGIGLSGWGGRGESGDARVDLGSLVLPCALLLGLPATFLLWGATGTASAQRDRRIQLLYWIGMSRLRSGVVCLLECVMLVAPGAALGAALAWAIGPTITWLPLTGFKPLPGDLSTTVGQGAAVAVLVSAAAGLASFGKGVLVPGRRIGTRPRAQPRLSPLALVPSGLGAALVGWQLANPPTSVSFPLLVATPLLLALGATLAAPFAVRVVARALADAARSVVTFLAGRAVQRDPTGFARPIIGLGVFAFVALVSVHILFVESRYQEEPAAAHRPIAAAVASIMGPSPDDAVQVASAALPNMLVAPIDRQTFAVAASCDDMASALDQPACDRDGNLAPGAGQLLSGLVGGAPGLPVRLVPPAEFAASPEMLPGVLVIGPNGPDFRADVANALTPTFLTVQVVTAADRALNSSGVWGWIQAGLAVGAILTGLGLLITAVDRVLRDPTLVALTRIGASTSTRRRIVVVRFIVAYFIVMTVLLGAGLLNGWLVLRSSSSVGYPSAAIAAVFGGCAVIPVIGALGLTIGRGWSAIPDAERDLGTAS